MASDFLPSPDSFSEPQVLPQVSSWLHRGTSVGLAGGSVSQSQPLCVSLSTARLAVKPLQPFLNPSWEMFSY